MFVYKAWCAVEYLNLNKENKIEEQEKGSGRYTVRTWCYIIRKEEEKEEKERKKERKEKGRKQGKKEDRTNEEKKQKERSKKYLASKESLFV